MGAPDERARAARAVSRDRAQRGAHRRHVPDEEYRALLRRARVFVCAPRREDYGIAQLEALADGCMLVTTSAPGPYAALPIARALDERLVGDDLASAAALRDRPGRSDARELSARALDRVVPFRR